MTKRRMKEKYDHSNTHMRLPVSFCRQLLPCRERHKLGDLLVFVQLLQRVEPLGEYRVWRKAMHSRMAVSAQTHAVPMQKFTCERLWLQPVRKSCLGDAFGKAATRQIPGMSLFWDEVVKRQSDVSGAEFARGRDELAVLVWDLSAFTSPAPPPQVRCSHG